MSFKIVFLFVVCPLFIFGQTNIHFSNSTMDDVMIGNYDPLEYTQGQPIMDPENIFQGIVDGVSPDSLASYLFSLSTFQNRNTGSDTMSDVRGMGAARRWCKSKFDEFSTRSENRLVNGYLVFDQDICGMGRHKNVVSILPGVGPNKDEVIFALAHLDSRCEDRCDINCDAHGMEDNGSGSALVLELARVMSQFSFDKTIVFVLTTGEEQGLHGANAMALYCVNNQINVKAAYNNDIVGGVICGETASPPGCPGLNHIDSINVRVYSAGGSNSKYKMLARHIKSEYENHLRPRISVKPVLNVMSSEDRGGRGGDHIPFGRNGYTTIRFTSANEHGHGNPADVDYHDRQHTMDDILGLDTDGDQILDSFFVDFNYLSRNTMLNANSMACAAFGPRPVEDFTLEDIPGGFIIEIQDPLDYDNYLVGVRKVIEHEFDTTIIIDSKRDTVWIDRPFLYYISVASIDENKVLSFFCLEKNIRVISSTDDAYLVDRIELMQNYPNPFDEATWFQVFVNQSISYEKAEIRVSDQSGRILTKLPITLNLGNNEVLYDFHHHKFKQGTYYYSLIIDDILFKTKTMIYAY